jgi:hypothetical protein
MQEDFEFEASLGYIGELVFKKIFKNLYKHCNFQKV